MPDSVGQDSTQPTTKRQWYGWQTLLTDAGSLLLIVAAAESDDSGGYALAGAAGYLAGGPIVHAAHGHAGKAWGSLGLRAGAPLGGALVGLAIGSASAGDCAGDLCGLEALAFGAVGFIIGTGAAIVIDAAVIANEDVKVERPRAKFTVAPSVAVTSKGAFTGLSGTF